MKEKIEELNTKVASKKYTIMAEINRPITIVKDQDEHYFILTESKLGQLVACNVSSGGKNHWVDRFVDLQNDLKDFDEKLYEPTMENVKM